MRSILMREYQHPGVVVTSGDGGRRCTMFKASLNYIVSSKSVWVVSRRCFRNNKKAPRFRGGERALLIESGLDQEPVCTCRCAGDQGPF